MTEPPSAGELAEAIDPVTFEVVKHRLWQITDEQGTTIRTVSSSPIVTEVNDFNVGLFTATGELVSAGPYVLFHVTTMDDMISHIQERATSVKKGDIFLCNDPDLGALHQNDTAVAAPVFRNGELVAWFSNTLHQVDVGGIDEGSFCINATDAYDEPPRFFLKLVDGGTWSNEAEYTYLKASRLPNRVEIDLRAQIAAINVAKSRFHGICDEYGVDTVTDTMDLSIDFAEDQLRSLIGELPDGTWSATGFMDDDGHTDTIYQVSTELRKMDTELHFDFSGSSDQSPSGLNATYESCYAASTTPIYAFLCDGEIDWNAAVKRVISVEAPPGTVVSSEYPAGVSVSTIGFTWLAGQIATKAFSELVLDSDAHRDRACPSWLGSWNGPSVFGTDASGDPFGTTLSEGKGGGAGGRSFADGFEHAGSLFAPQDKLTDVEVEEQKSPILYLYRRQRPDSGGPGRNRGGVGLETAFVPHRADEFRVVTNAFGFDHSPAAGIAGGYPGGSAYAGVADLDDLSTAFETGAIPNSFEEFDPEQLTHHRPKVTVDLADNEAMILFPPGGGGFGDPLLRSFERVRRDVETGRVTARMADEAYGVIVEGGPRENVSVDERASTQRRETRRERRLEESRLPGDEPLHSTGERCPNCEQVPNGIRLRAEELGEANPWISIRFQGHSPNFTLREELCEDCGTLLDVRQKLR